MNRLGPWTVCWWLCAVTAVASAAAVSAAEPATLGSIKVPEGFTVELVAAAPLVEHPLMAGFDDRGRLFVADNAGLNLPAEELLKQTPNMIRMLEDTDGDGRFDRSTVFADKMTFPQGVVWFRGALYVASPPSIWRLEDTDGDGRADRREEIVQKFGFIGNAADIHGCFVTPTGRIAWCDGRHGHEFKDGDGRATSKGLAARVFSCRPDGSNVEVFCGGGMDNPVEVAFTPEGETIGTMTFYNPDDARHDALVHFVYGGVYPRKHPCTSEFKRTGELMPALSRFGVVAPSGLTRHAGEAWGEAYRDNFYSVQFNTHKVIRHVLARQDGTFRATDEDFLISSNADFHPTDVLGDADGSLLVIDTGGWFRIGCPTSQIAKPEIGGGIYRIRRRNAASIADPRGLHIDWSATSNIKLADLLADPRPAVAERAIEELTRRGDGATGAIVTPLFDDPDYRARQNSVWALARIASSSAMPLLRQALGDDEPLVRQAAVHAVSDLRDAESLQPLIDMLSGDEDPAVRREVATALGRLGQGAAVPTILGALAKTNGRFVEHALIYALIEINDPAKTLSGLAHTNPSVRRGALIALDQIDSAPLTRAVVAPLLSTDDPALLRTLVDVISQHPDWGDELATTVDAWLAEANPSAEQMAMARGAISALLARPAVQKSVAQALTRASTAKDTRVMLLDLIASSADENSKPAWTAAVRAQLASRDSDVLRQAIATAAALDAQEFAARFSEIGLDEKQSTGVRVAALRAAAQAHAKVTEPAWSLLVSQLKTPGDLRDRLAAAEAIGRFDLSGEQRSAAARLTEHCGPLELSWLLRAFEHDASVSTGRTLAASLTRSPALASLSPDRLRDAFESYPPEVLEAARPLLDKAAPDDRQRAEQLKTLETAMSAGDSARGEDVFFGSRAACSACHRVACRGEKIGPDLSKIGEVRNRRDLLEAITFPSASLARGYESFNVVTKDGQVHSGLLSRETAAAVFLRTTDRAEVRVERGQIDELAPSRTSIMPQGMDKILSTGELADVIAYLQSLK